MSLSIFLYFGLVPFAQGSSSKSNFAKSEFVFVVRSSTFRTWGYIVTQTQNSSAERIQQVLMSECIKCLPPTFVKLTSTYLPVGTTILKCQKANKEV